MSDLDGRVQGLVGERRDIQLDIERGKLLDSERTRAFETVIRALEK